MTFVDSNVVIDILEPDPMWRDWSAARIADAAEEGPVRVSTIVVAECAGRFPSLHVLRATLAVAELSIDDLPVESAFLAGQAYRAHRRGQDGERRVLADFLIGAHALHAGAPLLTRDPRLYRRYFPDLPLITPETHP